MTLATGPFLLRSNRFSHRSSSRRGFSLLEALIALALVGVILLFSFAIQAQQLRERHGLETEERLLELGSSLAVSLQAGLHPLRAGAVDPRLAWPRAGPQRVHFFLDIEPAGAPGLCAVRIRGRAISRGGRWHDLELETRVWRPGASCQ